MRFLGFAEPSGVFLGEVVLVGAEVTRALSTPGRLTGTIPAGCVPAWLAAWECSIYAETPAGQVVGGGFVPLVDVADDGSVSVDCVGRAGYPQGMPWMTTEFSGVQVDPLDIVRMIWAHLQSQPGGHLGVTVDATSSPVRVGSEAEQVEFTTSTGEAVSFEAGPFTLDPWSTHDLGSVLDSLAADTPFDYLEHAGWDATGEALTHRLELGYPTIGARREDLRLVVGENVTQNPPLRGALAEYASEVLALGSGTGRTMVRATLTRAATGVRRVRVFTDKEAQNTTALTSSARVELDWATGVPQVEEITVIDSPHAPLAALSPGDQVRLAGGTPDARWERWVRLTQITTRPETDTATVRVQEV